MKTITDKALIEAGFKRICNSHWELELDTPVGGDGLEMSSCYLVYHERDIVTDRGDDTLQEFSLCTGDGSDLFLNVTTIKQAIDFASKVRCFVTPHSFPNKFQDFFKQFGKTRTVVKIDGYIGTRKLLAD